MTKHHWNSITGGDTIDFNLNPVIKLMFRFLFLLFIIIPLVEIGVFIQVGDQLGLGATLAIVIITAIIGVNLLKQQGFVAIRDIQESMNQGQLPALELASGAQLLFAGGLLLTPGFVTDSIGFLLMIPSIRKSIARFLIARISSSNVNSSNAHFNASSFHYSQTTHSNKSSSPSGRIIEGEIAADDAIDKEEKKDKSS